MKISLRGASIYLVLVAVAVAVNFVAYPLYAYDAHGESSDLSRDIWLVLDWFMAAGLFLMLITTLSRKRGVDNADAQPDGRGGTVKRGSEDDCCADARYWVQANLMFYGTVLLTLAFIPNWFAVAWGYGTNWTIWHLIDSVLPVMFVVEALRVWRLPFLWENA